MFVPPYGFFSKLNLFNAYITVHEWMRNKVSKFNSNPDWVTETELKSIHELKPLHDFVGENARGLNIYSNQFTNMYIYKYWKRARMKPTTYDMQPLTMRQFRTVTITMSWAKKKEPLKASLPTWISLEVRFAYKISETSWIVELSSIPTIYIVAFLSYLLEYEYANIRMHKP